MDCFQRAAQTLRLSDHLRRMAAALGEGWRVGVTDSEGVAVAGDVPETAGTEPASTPIRLDGAAVGRLWIAPPTEAQEPAQPWADVFGRMIESAMHTEQIRRAVTAEALASYREIALLHRAALDLGASLRRDEVATRLLEQFSGLSQVRWGAVYGNGDGQPKRLASHGEGAETLFSALEPAGLRSYLTADSVDGIVNDLHQDSRLAAARPHAGALLLVPLRSHGTGLGHLVLLAPPTTRFEAGDLHRAETLASIGAAALHNAELFAAREGLARRLLSAHEDERARLARELHDDMGQNLLAIKLHLQKINLTLEDAPLAPVVDEISASIHDLRRILAGLMPASLQSTGLGPTLKGYARSLAERCDLPITATIDDFPRPPPEVELHLFRIAQEALHNAVNHSGARRLQLSLRPTGSELILRIEDNGRGIDPRAVSGERSGMGLSTMEERARMMQGTFDIQGRPGQGTTVAVAVPLP